MFNAPYKNELIIIIIIIICLAFSYLKVENKKVQNKNRPEGMKNLHANPDEQQIWRRDSYISNI